MVTASRAGQPSIAQEASWDQASPHVTAGAALLERTQLCHAVALRGLLPCLGGVGALLPLAAQLDLPAAGWDLIFFSSRPNQCDVRIVPGAVPVAGLSAQ